MLPLPTVTGFHEESWQPAWGIRTALVGLSVCNAPSHGRMLSDADCLSLNAILTLRRMLARQSFFTTEAKGAIGGLDAPASERKRLAAL